MYEVFRNNRLHYYAESKRTDEILAVLRNVAQPRPPSSFSRPVSRSSRRHSARLIEEEVDTFSPIPASRSVEPLNTEAPQPETPKPESPQPKAQSESPRPESLQPESPQPEAPQPEAPQASPKPEANSQADRELVTLESHGHTGGPGRRTGRPDGPPTSDPMASGWEMEEYDSDPEEPEPTDPDNVEPDVPDRPVPPPLPRHPEEGRDQPDSQPEAEAVTQPDKPKPVPEQPARPDKPPATELETLKVLKLGTLVFLNSVEHLTETYEITHSGRDVPPQLVVRRGQAFQLKISTNRLYNAETDTIRLKFTTGASPDVGKGSVQFVTVDEERQPLAEGQFPPHMQWTCDLKSNKDRYIMLLVTPDACCIVGRWNVSIESWLQAAEEANSPQKISVYKHKYPVFILFNPMCKDDEVYMENEEERDEYVFNDTGKIYRGSYDNIHGKSWVFGQFEDVVLDCSLDLLDVVGLRTHARNNAALVCRTVSAAVNSQDEGGVLAGNWSGDYEGGTAPLAWVGSVQILEEYYKTKQPVKYGQCWVFSGLTTTVCRAFGIPTRSVTNFASAHDSDGSMTIDKHFDEDMKPLNHLDADSVWNFHVWNEAWLRRPDLPETYSKASWQAFDATPQETSEGWYQAGPCPLQAIKDGDVIIPFDGKFIFAEVNADRLEWCRVKNVWKVIKRSREGVGKKVSTKLPRKLAKPELPTSRWREDPERLDITNLYKYDEGSAEERKAVARAGLYSSKPDAFTVKGDLTVNLAEHDGETYLGEDIVVRVKLTNTSNENRTVEGTMVISSLYTTGVEYHRVKEDQLSFKLQPKQEKEVELQVTAAEYASYLIDDLIFGVSIMLKVAETEQRVVQRIDLRIRTPDPKITAPKSVKVGEKFTLNIELVNPLPVPLKKCHWVIDGPNFAERLLLQQKDIGAKAKVTKSVKLTPKNKGNVGVYVALGTDKAEFDNHFYTRAM